MSDRLPNQSNGKFNQQSNLDGKAIHFLEKMSVRAAKRRRYLLAHVKIRSGTIQSTCKMWNPQATLCQANGVDEISKISDFDRFIISSSRYHHSLPKRVEYVNVEIKKALSSLSASPKQPIQTQSQYRQTIRNQKPAANRMAHYANNVASSSSSTELPGQELTASKLYSCIVEAQNMCLRTGLEIHSFGWPLVDDSPGSWNDSANAVSLKADLQSIAVCIGKSNFKTTRSSARDVFNEVANMCGILPKAVLVYSIRLRRATTYVITKSNGVRVGNEANISSFGRSHSRISIIQAINLSIPSPFS